MKDKSHPEGSLDAKGITGWRQTAGNVGTPVEGFASDSGLGKPPGVGCYGQPSEDMIPSGEKKGGGTGGAIKAYFKGMGGGKP